MRDPTIELLRSVPLFQGLSNRELRQIRDAGTELEFPPGRMIVQEGATALDFYLIVSGAATVSRNARRVRSLGPGDFFGEIAVLDGGPRSATVVAETHLWAFRLERRAFLRLLSQQGSITSKMLIEVARRLRTAERPSLHV